MTLPSFWRQAAFSVVESARIINVPEDTLRTWMARCPYNDFLGAKTGGRIFLSGHDLYFWSLVRDLAAFGVGIRTVMMAVQPIANEAADRLPNIEKLVVRKTAPDVWRFERVDDPEFTESSAAVIPLRTLAIGVIGRAGVVYATEAE